MIFYRFDESSVRKSHPKKILHFSCDCSSDGAHGAFLKPLLQLGAAVAVGDIFRLCRPASTSACAGAGSDIPPRVSRGVLVSSSFSPGRKEEPGVPLQRGPEHQSGGVGGTRRGVNVSHLLL